MNKTTVNNSTIKYWIDIFFLQFLHFPERMRKDIKGILSYQLIFALQFGQNDLPKITPSLFGSL